jgi:preprotein translocase subunit SecB
MAKKEGTTKKDTTETSNGQTPTGGVPIAINSQYVKDFSFENPNAPRIFTEMKSAPDVKVDVNVEARKVGDVLYEVVLSINGQAKSDDKPVFVAELAYAALVTLKDVPAEAVQPVLLIEVPRVIFPFARNIMADMTREGGYPPLMINPVDFVSLYRQGVEKAQQKSKKA